MHRRLSRLAVGEDNDFFCLTDVDTPPSTWAALHTFPERKYPFPSCFDSTPNHQAMVGPRLTAERTTG